MRIPGWLSEMEAELADAKFRKVLVDKILMNFLRKPGETLSDTLNRCLRNHEDQALQEAIVAWMYTGMNPAEVAIDSALEALEDNITGGEMLAAGSSPPNSARVMGSVKIQQQRMAGSVPF